MRIQRAATGDRPVTSILDERDRNQAAINRQPQREYRNGVLFVDGQRATAEQQADPGNPNNPNNFINWDNPTAARIARENGISNPNPQPSAPTAPVVRQDARPRGAPPNTTAPPTPAAFDPAANARILADRAARAPTPEALANARRLQQEARDQANIRGWEAQRQHFANLQPDAQIIADLMTDRDAQLRDFELDQRESTNAARTAAADSYDPHQAWASELDETTRGIQQINDEFRDASQQRVRDWQQDLLRQFEESSPRPGLSTPPPQQIVNPMTRILPGLTTRTASRRAS